MSVIHGISTLGALLSGVLFSTLDLQSGGQEFESWLDRYHVVTT